MRIINRTEFLALPEGTVYCKYKSLGFLDQLCIKGRSWDNDWLYTNLIDLDADDVVDAWLEAEANSRTEIPLDISERRDGMFNADDRFVVFSKNDVLSMIEVLSKAIHPRLPLFRSDE